MGDYERQNMRRLVTVATRVSSLDLQKLRELATNENCSVSEYIRKKLLEVIAG